MLAGRCSDSIEVLYAHMDVQGVALAAHYMSFFDLRATFLRANPESGCPYIAKHAFAEINRLIQLIWLQE